MKPEPCLPRDEEVMTHDQVDKINKHDGNVKGVSEDKHEHHGEYLEWDGRRFFFSVSRQCKTIPIPGYQNKLSLYCFPN